VDLNSALKSAIHRNIIRFFHENQASVDTSRGIAAWIREDKATVKKALEDLVRLKVLEAHRSATMTGYGYTTDSKLISKLAKELKKKKR